MLMFNSLTTLQAGKFTSSLLLMGLIIKMKKIVSTAVMQSDHNSYASVAKDIFVKVLPLYRFASI